MAEAYDRAMFVLVFGRRARVRPLGERTAICGACLEKTLQDGLEVLESEHLYGVDVWSAGRRVLARCRDCAAMNPVVERPESAALPSDDAVRVDAFLDTAVPELARVQKGGAATALGSALGLVAFAAVGGFTVLLGWLQPSQPVGIAAFLVGTAAVVAGLVASYRALSRPLVRRSFASTIAPRLAKLVGRTGRSVADVAERARRLGHVELADALSSARLASIDPATGARRG